jgi:protein-disulfide isomerase
MLNLMSTVFDRLIAKRRTVLTAVIGLGLAVGAGGALLPARATDGKAATPIQLAQASTPATTAPAAADPFTAEQKTAIEKIIKDYLLNHPELMMEVQTALEAKMETLQAERLKAALTESANEIFRRPDAPIAGNPKGDITVVEFFDYNCGYCKRAFGDIAKLVDKDPKIKVVFKELPILSKGSEEASKVALAAKKQGKYWEAHRALISARGELNEQTALKAVDKLGLDMTKLKADMESPEVKAEIETVRNLAQKMGIQGTPHFLVGDKPIPGAPQNLLEVINGHVAELRKTGCSVC